jgi:hypothetical protein
VNLLLKVKKKNNLRELFIIQRCIIFDIEHSIVIEELNFIRETFDQPKMTGKLLLLFVRGILVEIYLINVFAEALRQENILRLIYCQLLGHPVEFAHILALKSMLYSG